MPVKGVSLSFIRRFLGLDSLWWGGKQQWSDPMESKINPEVAIQRYIATQSRLSNGTAPQHGPRSEAKASPDRKPDSQHISAEARAMLALDKKADAPDAEQIRDAEERAHHARAFADR